MGLVPEDHALGAGDFLDGGISQSEGVGETRRNGVP